MFDERPDIQARLDDEMISDGPAADEDAVYLAKYREPMEDIGMTPAACAAEYPIRIHVRPTRLRAS